MSPGFAVRLQSMRRALTTVIMPAIDPANQIAQEQAALMVAHIGMFEMQWERLDDYARLCRDDLIELVGRLDARGGAMTEAAAAELATMRHGPPHRAEAAYQALSAGLEALVRAADVDGEADFRATLRREVLLHGNRQAARDRAWFIACGFDVNAAELASIDELLGEAAGG